MLKALDYEILHGVKVDGKTRIPVQRRPVRVATILNEAGFLGGRLMSHHHTVFLETSRNHWFWLNGEFRYFSRVAPASKVADVLIVYAFDNVAVPAGFDPVTGISLSASATVP